MTPQSKAKRRKAAYDLRSLKIEANSVDRIIVPSPTQDERRFAGVIYDGSPVTSRTKSKKRAKKKPCQSPGQVNTYLHLPKLATVIAKNELGRSQYRHSVHLPIAEKDREKHKNGSGEETLKSNRTRVKSASNAQGKPSDRFVLPDIASSTTVKNTNEKGKAQSPRDRTMKGTSPTEKTPSRRSKGREVRLPWSNDQPDAANFRKKYETIRDTEERIMRRREEQNKTTEQNEASRRHHLCSVCSRKQQPMNESTKIAFTPPSTQPFRPEGISFMRDQRRLSIYLPMVNFEESDLL